MMRINRFQLPRQMAAIVAFCAFAAACTLPASSGAKANGCPAGAEQPASPDGLKQVTLCIASSQKTHSFTAEIANTSAEQAKGLMFRMELGDEKAMIFPFREPRVASFWMKNTVIPLDIIFIRADGTIESIAENTIPYSTDPVEAGEPVTAVLELRGGLTAELGIGPSDTVRWTAK